MIHVYHLYCDRTSEAVMDAMFGMEGAIAKLWKEEPYRFGEVAAVAGGRDDLERAFELTNTITHHWSENKGLVTDYKDARSTSVGDVMVVDGRSFAVESFGFSEIVR